MAMALGIVLYMTRISANPSPVKWIVDPRGSPYGTHSSISDALADASDGDVIWVRNGTYYEHEGKRYFYLETTGEGWQIGQLPPEIIDIRVSIYPLR